MQTPTDNYYRLIHMASFLKRVALFHHFSPAYLTSLAKITKTIRLSAGQTLFRQNEFADCLYIIRKGKAGVEINGHELIVLGRFECLGELSIFVEPRRSATAVAKTDLLLLQIASEDFRNLLNIHSGMSLVLMRTLAQRLREREALGSR